MQLRRTTFLFAAIFAIACTVPCLGANPRAPLQPNPLFQDHMVLQRDVAAPIWGRAEPGESITVAFAGQRQTATADAAGRWRLSLEPLKASTSPAELTIRGQGREITFRDVLVGEVWLASGQSNMTFRFQPAFYPDEAAHPDALVRTANVSPAGAMTPQETVRVEWLPCTRQSIAQFSSVSYFFAKRLADELHIPVAVIHSSWEGTRAEPWISRATLLADPALRDVARQQINDLVHRADDDKAFGPKMIAWEKKFGAADDSTLGVDAGWGKPDFDTRAWQHVTIPADFRAAGLPGGGIVWFRKELNLPAEAAGKPIELNPGYTVDMVQAFWNGKPLKSTYDHPDYYPHGQGFSVPGELVKAGRNVVSIRIHGHAEGHFWCVTKDMRLPISAAEQQSNDWLCKVEKRFPDPTPESNAALPKAPDARPEDTPGCLFNGMIHPLVPFAIRGAIWYQGESNVFHSHEYAKTLATLVRDWRGAWGTGDFPFYIVQLANLGRPPKTPEESDWAEVREAQEQVARTVPNTGLAVTIDIGEENDIHPRDKRDVGDRLALNALAKTYGRDVEWSGPRLESVEFAGHAARLKFSHAAGGLVARDGPLRRFEIAGSDQKFVWADATIDGQNVTVSSAAVEHPAAVRYAWAKNPAGCNLYNRAGLPASPFRTDKQP